MWSIQVHVVVVFATFLFAFFAEIQANGLKEYQVPRATGLYRYAPDPTLKPRPKTACEALQFLMCSRVVINFVIPKINKC